MNTPRIDFSKYQYLIDRKPKPQHITNRPPDHVDVMCALGGAEDYAKKTGALIISWQKKLEYYNRLKELTDWQKKDKEEKEKAITIIGGLMHSTSVVVRRVQLNEAQAYKDMAAASEDDNSIRMVMNERIQRLEQELRAKNETIQLLTELVV